MIKRLWADGMRWESKQGNMNSYSSFMFVLIPISLAMFVNVITILLWLKIFLGWSFSIDLLPAMSIKMNRAIFGLTLCAILLSINYFMFFRKRPTVRIVSENRPRRYNAFLIYLVGSWLIFIIPIILAFVME